MLNLMPLDSVPEVGQRVFWQAREDLRDYRGWYTVTETGQYENLVELSDDDGQTYRAYCHELYVGRRPTVKHMQIAVAMMYMGGGFVSRLGYALLKADLDNSRRIIEAFPEYVEEYAENAKVLKLDNEERYYEILAQGISRVQRNQA